jgi:hypothetical protein
VHARQHEDGKRTHERQSGTKHDGDRENFRWAEIVSEEKLGRLTKQIEERLGYCDTGKRCDVKWS